MEFSNVYKYAPYIFFDEKEPFLPMKVGYAFYDKPSASLSFKRNINFYDSKIKFVIEYALYWDFDIQHLYDLEHVWVYVDTEGNVAECEASFHGKYFRGLLRDRSNIEDGTHVKLFCQPGKHAFAPMAELFELIPNVERCTWEDAGNDGLIVTDVGKGRYETNEAIDEIVHSYIQKNFIFRPSGKFYKYEYPSDVFIPWKTLYDEIPDLVTEKLEEIKAETINK
jgi:hypothetical protein